jgi:N-(2-amino-2-carboxyethyl)-L-glutamate synthase
MGEGILSAIGNTPLVQLKRVIADIDFRLYAKLECLNPGGSMKDRPALAILRHALESGDLKPGAVVIESSSGNMGIGLAQACLYLGLKFICVVDPKTTQQNIRLMKAYGAEVDLVKDPDAATGEYLQARLNRVQELLGSNKGGFWPNQYANIHNSNAHHETMHEIVKALNGKVDYLFCATSTCGTLRGCAEYIRKQNLSTKLYAVDAVGSVIFGGKKANRIIPGHGATVRPALYQDDLAYGVVHVTDIACVQGCRRLAMSEALLAGGSSGAVLSAVEQIKKRILPGSNCVMILADRGDRYLDTIYSDEWVYAHFGDVRHLWENLSRCHYASTAD